MELELGSLLKRARQEKGLSLDDIQEETKIRKKYLEAIEENNFDVLPGNVYLKVFIKGYAREVGIDYQKLLENYEILTI
ncbi:MAG: helix-turn-helix domain-containing protein, partial [Halanaerobium sp.]